MHRPLLIILLVYLVGSNGLMAQDWTKKDSVWLQQVLSGKEKLELSPEATKAIQSGSLLNMDGAAVPMQPIQPNPLPITKDFTEYIQTDSTRRKVAPRDLPPYVFWLYAPPPGIVIPVYQSMLDAWEDDPENRSHNTGVAFDAGKLTSRKARTHKRNAKRDGTRKNYNNLPTPDIIKKKKKYAKDNPEKAGQDTLLLRKDSLQLKDTMFINKPGKR